MKCHSELSVIPGIFSCPFHPIQGHSPRLTPLSPWQSCSIMPVSNSFFFFFCTITTSLVSLDLRSRVLFFTWFLRREPYHCWSQKLMPVFILSSLSLGSHSVKYTFLFACICSTFCVLFCADICFIF